MSIDRKDWGPKEWIVEPIKQEKFGDPVRLAALAIADLGRWPSIAADSEMSRQHAFYGPHPYELWRLRYNYFLIAGAGLAGFLGATIKLPFQMGLALTQEAAIAAKKVAKLPTRRGRG